MKKFIASIVLATMFFCAPSAKADVYSDGVRKIATNGVAIVISSEDLSQLSKITGQGSLSKQEILDMIVETMTPYYRENMSEEEFLQMVDFYSREDVKAVYAKVSSSKNDGKFAEMLQGAFLMIMQGQTPDDIVANDCDAEYKKAFDRYCEVCRVEESFSRMSGTMSTSLSQMIPGIPTEYQETVKGMIDNLFAYMQKNIKTVMLNGYSNHITVDDLNLLSSEADMPFYAASQKASMACLGDLGTLVSKVLKAVKQD